MELCTSLGSLLAKNNLPTLEKEWVFYQPMYNQTNKNYSHNAE